MPEAFPFCHSHENGNPVSLSNLDSRIREDDNLDQI